MFRTKNDRVELKYCYQYSTQANSLVGLLGCEGYWGYCRVSPADSKGTCVMGTCVRGALSGSAPENLET